MGDESIEVLVAGDPFAGVFNGVAAPLFAVRIAPVIGEEVLECPQQIRTETALGGIDLADAGSPEHSCEEGLGEFFALVLTATFPAQEAIDRVPVGLAELTQGGAGIGRLPRARLTIVQRVVWKAGPPGESNEGCRFMWIRLTDPAA